MTEPNYIKSFIDILREHTDIPRQFCIAGGYHISAITIGRFFELHDFSGMRPNLYILLASAPRFTRRGELIKCVNHLIKSTFEVYHTQLQHKKHYCLNEFKSHSFGGGTPQGLIDDINYFKSKRIESFAVCSTEFGRTLEDIQRKGTYSSGLDEVYCKLWTGEPYYESFSRRKSGDKGEPRFLEEGAYFNILGTMQKAETYITNKKLSLKGTMRRISLFNVDGIDVLSDYKPPLGRNTESLYKKLHDVGVNLGNLMYTIHKEKEKKGRLIPITYTDSAKEFFNKYDEELTKLAKKDDTNPYYLYLQGLFEQTLKFAMHITITNNRREITLDDAIKGQQHAENATKNIKEILESTLIPEHKQELNKNLNRIINYIKQGLDKRTLQQRMSRFGVRGEDYTNLLKILISEKQISLNEDRTKYIFKGSVDE